MAKPKLKSNKKGKDISKPIDVFSLDIGQDNIDDLFGAKKIEKNEFGIDYQSIGITDETVIIELNKCASNMKFNFDKSTEHLLAFAANLKKAQDTLSLSGSPNGAFVKWYTQLGLDKNVVYRVLDRYNIFISTKNEKAMTVPQNIISYFKKSEAVPATINKILSSENPSKEFKKYKVKNNDDVNVIENEYVRLENELKSIELEINKLLERKKVILDKMDKIHPTDVEII